MAVPRKPQALRKQFSFALHETARIWRNRLNERFRPLGLHQLEWLVLGYLWRTPGGLVQRELAERVGIEGPGLVRVLDRLQTAGLIRRCACPGDRRAKIVRLGPKAGPVLRRLIASADRLRNELMQDIPDADVQTTLNLLHAVQRRLEHV